MSKSVRFPSAISVPAGLCSHSGFLRQFISIEFERKGLRRGERMEVWNWRLKFAKTGPTLSQSESFSRIVSSSHAALQHVALFLEANFKHVHVERVLDTSRYEELILQQVHSSSSFFLLLFRSSDLRSGSSYSSLPARHHLHQEPRRSNRPTAHHSRNLAWANCHALSSSRYLKSSTRRA